MKFSNACWLLLAFCVSAFYLPHMNAQEAAAQSLPGEKTANQSSGTEPDQSKTGPADQGSSNQEQKDREIRLAKYLTGAKFLGNFTIQGKSDTLPKPEAYTISKCEKLPQADMYRLTARIKYGEIDSEVPLDLKILWAGRTPVITMDAFWIPGMGTFGARVLIHSGRYAGTWQHDEVGGHLFGVIKKE
ncbi:MAG: hypothetical protein CMM01_03770 [Rhodopirellula sp.]|nr:hypothetical protein [Rhodopirellula sp.]